MLAALIFLVSWQPIASAATIGGAAEPDTSGQFMALSMTIDDTTTRFTLTGPDYSWYAFGFDTMTMLGYSLIIEGTDGNRTAVEQNLLGIGSPGDPQATQNINIVSTSHDSANDLTTVVIERANNTGDVNDPVFTTDMESLDFIWAYDSFATPSTPNPNLTYHGFGGRGFDMITFSVIPEPATALLLIVAAGMAPFLINRRGR
jgi:hypothetical protein